MVIHYECEICGKPGRRVYPNDKVPAHFFCSRDCQNKWQTTREDIVQKNKDPEFRKKVSAGLKRRKEILGDNYHSPETKQKIGKATLEHWDNYDEKTRQKMLDTLNSNAQAKRTYGPYDMEWKRISADIRKNAVCQRCGNCGTLAVHHIIPVSAGGNRDRKNLVVLCPGCHTAVESAERKVFEIIPDWNIVQSLVRERLGLYEYPNNETVGIESGKVQSPQRAEAGGQGVREAEKLD